MKIAGLVKTSLIDYPGEVAAVVFTQGCNFRCGFCHNPDLLPIQSNKLKMILEDEFFEYLSERKGKLDGVVITGGEPTIQKDLIDFIKKIRALGFLVKLDTNGSNPDILKALLDENLLDYVAMDIKGPLEKYEKICGFLNTKFIHRSIEILLNSSIKYEFRTTVLPFYHEFEDFEKIGKLIQGAPKFTVQGFRSEITYDKNLAVARAFTKDDLEKVAVALRPYVAEVAIHDNV